MKIILYDPFMASEKDKLIGKEVRRVMASARPRKITSIDLALKMNLTQSKVENLLGGKITFTPELLREIAEALDLPHDWASSVGKEVSDPRFAVTYLKMTIKHAGQIPAGQWSDPGESEEFCEVEARLFKTNRFCAEIVGESCYPALQPGDFTIWEANRNPKLNKIIIAERYPDHAATVKVLIWDADLKRPALFAINPAFQEPLSEHWDAIAFLVHVSYTDDDGGEITFYREDGIRPEQLIKYRGEK